MKLKRITLDALLTTIALTIFIVELQIPPLIPIPGVKLGLANVVTVFAVFLLGPKDAACILLARILLGGIFSGRMLSLVYSLSGGLMCFFFMLLMRRIVTEKQLWVCSVIGAIAHNMGQILAAVFITGIWAVFSYLPVLMISGICAGVFTGLSAQFLVNRTKFFLFTYINGAY